MSEWTTTEVPIVSTSEMNDTKSGYSGGKFDWMDYTVFFMMLGFSTLIGIYFGCFKNKQKTVDEYLLGGKNMKVIPVAWSLIATSISGVTLIGVPAEFYTDDASYWLLSPALALSAVFAYYLFIPIFMDLDMPSTCQYLELRFDRSVRVLASWFFSIAFLLFLPAVIYVPSLIMSQVTGINVYIISIGVTSICVFYTMIGGLKAVIWTDFLQLSILIVTCIILISIGTKDAGGFWGVIETSYENGKFDVLNFDPNIFQRNTFWTIFVGGFFTCVVSIGTSQSCVQRYLSLSHKENLKWVLVVFVVGLIVVNTTSIYSGAVTYKTYFGCDPIEQKEVEQPDQIFSYFVIDRLGYVPVLPGLFIAGIFSAALSTLSTAFNTIAGLIYEDNLRRWGLKDEKAKLAMRLIIVIIGIFSVAMVVAIKNMGKILSVVFILTSITSTPVSVLFVLGMMVPTANKKGATAGAVSCALLLAWIAIGSTLAKINFVSKKVYPVDTCPVSKINVTEIHNATSAILPEPDDVFILYKLSYLMYSAVGLIVGMIVGVATTYLTGPTDPATVDPRLISPPIRKYLPEYKNKQPIDLSMKLITSKDGFI